VQSFVYDWLCMDNFWIGTLFIYLKICDPIDLNFLNRHITIIKFLPKKTVKDENHL